jgi:hypothetical protein
MEKHFWMIDFHEKAVESDVKIWDCPAEKRIESLTRSVAFAAVVEHLPWDGRGSVPI